VYFVKLYPINVELSGLDRFLWRMLFSETHLVFGFGLGLPMPDGENENNSSILDRTCVMIPEAKKSEMVLKLKDRIIEFYIRRVFYTSSKGRIPTRCAYVLYMTMRLSDLACIEDFIRGIRTDGGETDDIVEKACRETMFKVENFWQSIPELSKTHGYCFVHFPSDFRDDSYVKFHVIFSSVTFKDKVVNFSKKELLKIRETWNKIARL